MAERVYDWLDGIQALLDSAECRPDVLRVHSRKHESLFDAIDECLLMPGLKEQLEKLEARVKEFDSALEAPAPTPVRFRMGLADAYRKRVGELGQALRDPESRFEALEIIRALITRLTHRRHIVETGKERFSFKASSTVATRKKKEATQPLT